MIQKQENTIAYMKLTNMDNQNQSDQSGRPIREGPIRGPIRGRFYD